MANLSNDLWRDRNERKNDRFRCYHNILDTLVTKIYFQQDLLSMSSDSKNCYIKEYIDRRYAFQSQQPYYDQKECVEYIIKELRNLGFFAKSIQNKTCVFISWHPSHLEIMKVYKDKKIEKIKKEEKQLQKKREEKEEKERLQQLIFDEKKRREENLKSIASTKSYSVKSVPSVPSTPFIDLDGNDNSHQNRIKLTNFLLSQNKNY